MKYSSSIVTDHLRKPEQAHALDVHFAVEPVLLSADLRFRGRAPPNGRPTVRPIATPPRPAGARFFSAFLSEPSLTEGLLARFFSFIAIPGSWFCRSISQREIHTLRPENLFTTMNSETMDGLSSSLAVLTAMITPAVLISASGTMILSSSVRLGRVVDRVRSLSDRLLEISREGHEEEFLEERRAMLYDQLDKLTSRSRLLQRGLTTFYLAVGIFVATSVAIGVASFTGTTRFGWIPLAFGLLGAFFLFYGSMLLVFEARLALSTTHAEMDFIWRTTKSVVPKEIVEQHKTHYVHFRKKSDG